MNPDSKPRKISNEQSPLTELKLLWRDTFIEPERDYWREQISSSRTQADIRSELKDKYKIDLPYDIYVTRFRRWVAEQDELEEETCKSAADRAELEAQGLTGDQLRNELLRRAMARAVARGDFKLGLRAIAEDIKVETLQLHKDKFKHNSRSKIEAGLAQLGLYIRDNPGARAAYDAFRATIPEASK